MSSSVEMSLNPFESIQDLLRQYPDEKEDWTLNANKQFFSEIQTILRALVKTEIQGKEHIQLVEEFLVRLIDAIFTPINLKMLVLMNPHLSDDDIKELLPHFDFMHDTFENVLTVTRQIPGYANLLGYLMAQGCCLYIAGRLNFLLYPNRAVYQDKLQQFNTSYVSLFLSLTDQELIQFLEREKTAFDSRKMLHEHERYAMIFFLELLSMKKSQFPDGADDYSTPLLQILSTNIDDSCSTRIAKIIILTTKSKKNSLFPHQSIEDTLDYFFTNFEKANAFKWFPNSLFLILDALANDQDPRSKSVVAHIKDILDTLTCEPSMAERAFMRLNPFELTEPKLQLTDPKLVLEWYAKTAFNSLSHRPFGKLHFDIFNYFLNNLSKKLDNKSLEFCLEEVLFCCQKTDAFLSQDKIDSSNIEKTLREIFPRFIKAIKEIEKKTKDKGLKAKSSISQLEVLTYYLNLLKRENGRYPGSCDAEITQAEQLQSSLQNSSPTTVSATTSGSAAEGSSLVVSFDEEENTADHKKKQRRRKNKHAKKANSATQAIKPNKLKSEAEEKEGERLSEEEKEDEGLDVNFQSALLRRLGIFNNGIARQLFDQWKQERFASDEEFQASYAEMERKIMGLSHEPLFLIAALRIRELEFYLNRIKSSQYHHVRTTYLLPPKKRGDFIFKKPDTLNAFLIDGEQALDNSIFYADKIINKFLEFKELYEHQGAEFTVTNTRAHVLLRKAKTIMQTTFDQRELFVEDVCAVREFCRKSKAQKKEKKQQSNVGTSHVDYPESENNAGSSSHVAYSESDSKKKISFAKLLDKYSKKEGGSDNYSQLADQFVSSISQLEAEFIQIESKSHRVGSVSP